MIIVNILAIPFALLGLITIIRGCWSVIENDSHLFEKQWKFNLYAIANYLGILALVLAIVQWVKFQ